MLCFQKEGSLLLKNKTTFSNLVSEVTDRIFLHFSLIQKSGANVDTSVFI